MGEVEWNCVEAPGFVCSPDKEGEKKLYDRYHHSIDPNPVLVNK